MDSLIEAEMLVKTELEKQIQTPEMKKDLKGFRTFWMPVKYPEERLEFIWSRAGGIQEEVGRPPKQAVGTF
jgi:hypothetical protein